MNYFLNILKEAKSEECTASRSSSFLRSFRSSLSNFEVSAVLLVLKYETNSFESRICSNVPNSCISAIAFSKLLIKEISCLFEALSKSCQAVMRYLILISFFLFIKSLFLFKECAINKLKKLNANAIKLIISDQKFSIKKH